MSQLAVQHAVDMAARAGREALTLAVAQTEEWCTVRKESGECKEFKRGHGKRVNFSFSGDRQDRKAYKWARCIGNVNIINCHRHMNLLIMHNQQNK